MTNLLRELRKQNDEQQQLLTAENSSLLRDIISYLYSCNLSDYDVQALRRDLINLAASCEMGEQSFPACVGADAKAFCRRLAADCTPKSKWENFWGYAYVFVVGLGLLALLEFLLPGLLREHIYREHFLLSINLGFVLCAFLIFGAAVLIYSFTTRSSFAFSGVYRKRYLVGFMIGFIAICCALVLIKVLFGTIILFKINALLALLIWLIGYAVVKIIDYHNQKKYWGI